MREEGPRQASAAEAAGGHGQEGRGHGDRPDGAGSATGTGPSLPMAAQGAMRPSLGPADRLLAGVARLLAGATGVDAAGQANPADACEGVQGDGGDDTLSAAERRHAAGLMRVNHVGEVCAQALYQGHALTIGNAQLAALFEQAAAEERDHLAWTRARLDELGASPSRLNPLWYTGALALGALAGLAGPAKALGFMAETERQVEAHLASHLERLPAHDHRSRAIVRQMRDDEARHADHALAAGGVRPPAPIAKAMKAAARVMTTVAYRV